MRRPPSTVTELLGLPGAGKSTLERTVAASGTLATATDWRGPLPWFGLPMTIELFLQAPLFSAVAYLAVAARSGATAAHIRRVRSVQRRHIVVRRMQDVGTVLDEGPVHALFLTLYGTRETPVSRVLLRLVLTLLTRNVGRYLYLDTPKERCIHNFSQPGRTSGRFNADSPQRVIDEFYQDRTYDQILDGLRRTGAPLSVAPSPSAAWAMLRTQTRVNSTAGSDLRELKR